MLGELFIPEKKGVTCVIVHWGTSSYSGDVSDGARKEYTDVRAKACVISDPQSSAEECLP